MRSFRFTPLTLNLIRRHADQRKDAGTIAGRLVRGSLEGRQRRNIGQLWLKIPSAKNGQRHDRKDSAAAESVSCGDIPPQSSLRGRR